MSKQDTIITVENSSWRIRLYLGLGGLVVLTVLAFVYRLEAGLTVLAIGLGYAARLGFQGYHAHKLAGFERRRLEAEAAKIESEAIQARARTHFVETNSGVFVLEGIAVAAFYPAVSASKLLADVPQLALPAPAPQRRRLLDVEYIHLLITGPSGTGKTTVLCHLIDGAPSNTLIYALDPHAQFGEWPSRVNEIVGNGRDYAAIDARLLSLMEVMNRRYNGAEATDQKVLIVADEWLSILDRCPSAKDFFNTIGSEARKVNMSLVISSISATVDDLAVSAAIRDNLAQLTLTRAWRRDNLAELKLSRADKEMVELPGRYIPRGALPAAIPAPVDDGFDPLDFDSGPVAASPDPVELRIYELYQQGNSLNAIHREVYPERTYGGVQAAELKAILAKFGVSL